MEPIDEELLYVLSLVPNQNNAAPSELLDDILKNGITWPKIDPKSDAYDQEPGEEALLTLPARYVRAAHAKRATYHDPDTLPNFFNFSAGKHGSASSVWWTVVLTTGLSCHTMRL